MKIFFLCAFFVSFSLFAEEQTLTQDGIKVRVTKSENTLKGFQAFRVVAENTNGTDKSLELHIKLDDGAAGDCTIMFPLQAGQSSTEDKQCKETAPSSSWKPVIQKIYNFLVK